MIVVNHVLHHRIGTYVFVRPHVHVKTAFSKSSVFIDRFHQIRVDGSRIRKEKTCVFNSKRIRVDRALKSGHFTP